MKKLIFTILSMIATEAQADDWFCRSQSSKINGLWVTACGIGEGKTENDARLAAFESAKSEFKQICGGSDWCPSQEVTINPLRTECEVSDGGYKCYRAIEFQTQKRVPMKVVGNVKPEMAMRLAIKAKIFKGMAKKALLAAIGMPTKVDDFGDGSKTLYYFGRPDVCGQGKNFGGNCHVHLDGGKVAWYKDVDASNIDIASEI